MDSPSREEDRTCMSDPRDGGRLGEPEVPRDDAGVQMPLSREDLAGAADTANQEGTCTSTDLPGEGQSSGGPGTSRVVAVSRTGTSTELDQPGNDEITPGGELEPGRTVEDLPEGQGLVSSQGHVRHFPLGNSLGESGSLPATVPGQRISQSGESSDQGLVGTPHIQLERGSHGTIGFTHDTQGFTPLLSQADRAVGERRTVRVVSRLSPHVDDSVRVGYACPDNTFDSEDRRVQRDSETDFEGRSGGVLWISGRYQ